MRGGSPQRSPSRAPFASGRLSVGNPTLADGVSHISGRPKPPGCRKYRVGGLQWERAALFPIGAHWLRSVTIAKTSRKRTASCARRFTTVTRCWQKRRRLFARPVRTTCSSRTRTRAERLCRVCHTGYSISGGAFLKRRWKSRLTISWTLPEQLLLNTQI